MKNLFDQGYLRLGTWRGAPIRLHWTTPLGALFFGRFNFVPAFWLSFIGLVLIHELGHAFMVHRARRQVLSIDAHGFGGWCRWSGQVSAVDRALIAWGGVLFQAALLVPAGLAVLIFGWPSHPWGYQVAHVLTTTNLWLIGFNLLPLAPLDGKEAWTILPILKIRWATRRGVARRKKEARRVEKAKDRSVKQSLDVLDTLEYKLSSHAPIVIRSCATKAEAEHYARHLDAKGINSELRETRSDDGQARYALLVKTSDAGRAASQIALEEAKMGSL